MFVKYQLHDENTPDMSMVADICWRNGDIELSLTRHDLCDVVIKDVQEYEYSLLISQLFNTGRVDLSRFKEKTFLNEE